MLIYVAAPRQSEAELSINQHLAVTLEGWGYRVFLPQRDGTGRHGLPYDVVAPEERRRALSHVNKEKIAEASVVLWVLNGRPPDEGVCVELGLAYASKTMRQNKKVLVGYRADAQTTAPPSASKAMLRIPLDRIVETEEELLYCLRHYQEQGTLGVRR